MRIEVAAIKAVHFVESKGAAFFADGFPSILFERHKFWKHADKSKRAEWRERFPSICNPKATPRDGYGTHHEQRIKFNQAFELDKNAAMMACSWGAFQELGENFEDLGFETVGAFVDKMKESEMAQLEIFVRSIKHRGLADELRRRDWAGFARNYNGAGYRKFNYDGQIEDAYTKFSKIKYSLSTDNNGLASSNPISATAGNAVEIDDAPADSAQNSGAAHQPDGEQIRPDTDAAQNNAVSPAPDSNTVVTVQQAEPAKSEPDTLITKFKAWYLAIPAGITAYLSAAAAWAKDAPVNLVIVLLAIAGLIVVAYIIANLFIKNRRENRENELKLQREKQSHELTVLQAKSAMDKTVNTIQILPTPIQNSDSEPAHFAGFQMPRRLSWKQRILGVE